MRGLKRVAFLALLITGCVRAAPPPAAPATPVPLAVRALVIHVDTDFAPSELVLMHVAADRLRTDTKGRLEVTFTVDIDFRKKPLPQIPSSEWIVARLDDGEEAEFLDRAIGGHVVGATSVEKHVTYLIPSRTETINEYVHVAMHEMLHSLGCQHTRERAGIMYADSNSESRIVMTPTDIQEFCRATGLKGEPCL